MEGQFNGGFFCVAGLGGFYLEGLIHGGAYFQNFTVFYSSFSTEDYYFKDDVNKPCRMHLSYFYLLCAVSYYGEGKKLNGGGIRKHVKNHEKDYSVHD